MPNAIILLVFFLTYLGLAAGRLPWFRVDRTGIALLGAIALLGTETVTIDDISGSIDISTLVLLFALMIISAQFLSAGFYDLCADWITARHSGPVSLLALTVTVCGALTALLANDIVVFAMAPLLIAGARARGYDPRPFLIALVTAANTGSAATLISSPQNIYLGQIGNLSFHHFLARLRGAGDVRPCGRIRRDLVPVARPGDGPVARADHRHARGTAPPFRP